MCYESCGIGAFAENKKLWYNTVVFFFYSDRVENIVEKGENAGYQHFLFFSVCFQILYGLFKIGIV